MPTEPRRARGIHCSHDCHVPAPMAAAGEVLPLLGGSALTEDHAALWLAVLELLAQLQRKTGAGRLRRGPIRHSLSVHSQLYILRILMDATHSGDE